MIEVRNETNHPIWALVCQGVHGTVYVHVMDDDREIHGEQTTRIGPKDYDKPTIVENVL